MDNAIAIAGDIGQDTDIEPEPLTTQMQQFPDLMIKALIVSRGDLVKPPDHLFVFCYFSGHRLDTWMLIKLFWHWNAG